MSCGLCGFLDRCTTAENDQVRQRNLLSARCRSVELPLDCFEFLQYPRQLRRLVDGPVLLRRQTNARAVRSTALIRAAEGRRRSPSRRHQLGNGQPRREDFRLQSGNLLLPDQRMIHRGNRVLPRERLLRNEWAEITHDRAHVTVSELEPRTGKRVCELIRVR